MIKAHIVALRIDRSRSRNLRISEIDRLTNHVRAVAHFRKRPHRLLRGNGGGFKRLPRGRGVAGVRKSLGGGRAVPFSISGDPPTSGERSIPSMAAKETVVPARSNPNSKWGSPTHQTQNPTATHDHQLPTHRSKKTNNQLGASVTAINQRRKGGE